MKGAKNSPVNDENGIFVLTLLFKVREVKAVFLEKSKGWL